MPVISTDDAMLHRQLKIYVAQHPGLTIGKATEIFIKLGMDLNLNDLTEKQLDELKDAVVEMTQSTIGNPIDTSTMNHDQIANLKEELDE